MEDFFNAEKIKNYDFIPHSIIFSLVQWNIICTLPKAISYGNCRMKIQHKICVKRSKLFLIGGRTPLPNGKFCY